MDDDLLNDLEDLGEDVLSDYDHEIDTEMQIDNISAPHFNSEKLRRLLDNITNNVIGDTTISEATNFALELEYEIGTIHKRILDLYAMKFPELEKLVHDPLLLTKTIKAIGNEIDIKKVDLKFLPNATVMGIILASTTFDTQLSESDLNQVNGLCDMVLEMDQTKDSLIQFVAARMELIAPNLVELLGSNVAAKLIGLAGGLKELNKIPACNVLVMGAQKKASLGFSSITLGKHQGVIYETDLVANSDIDIKRKVARLLSNKAVLACRCDLSGSYKDGKMGQDFRRDVMKKIDLLTAPPPAKQIKALPLPIEHKKKRGGARARREKARNGVSELQKAQNRMAFGEQEEEIIDATGEMIGLGLINGSSGKLKLAKKEFKSIID